MPRPTKLDNDAVARWLGAHPGWEKSGEGALTRTFTFADFADAMGFAVRLGMAAERKDHHPDIAIGWGRATVAWSTHDAGGITGLDLELAETSERLADTKAP